MITTSSLVVVFGLAKITENNGIHCVSLLHMQFKI